MTKVKTVLTMLVPQGEEWVETDDVRVTGWAYPGTRACADCPATGPSADIDAVEYDVVDPWGGKHRTQVDLDNLPEETIKSLEQRLIEQAAEDEESDKDTP